MITALTILLIGASNLTPAGQVGDEPSLRTQLLEAEFIGLVRPGAPEIAAASSDIRASTGPQCERIELELVEAWRGEDVGDLAVRYPANRLWPRPPHLPEGELCLVFLRRNPAGDWLVFGPTVEARDAALPETDQHAIYRAAFRSWSELDALDSDDRPLAEYRWLADQLRQPALRSRVVGELAGRWNQHRWQPGRFAARAAQEPASFWLSTWPEASAFTVEGGHLLVLLRQSDGDTAAAWLLGQLDAAWIHSSREDWSQLLATLTALAADARYADADRGETAFLSFLDRWLESDAAGRDPAKLRPDYLKLRVELLDWLAQSDAVHRSPW